jgi:hypothetical protein
MVISIGGASRADQFWKMRISGITDNGKHFFRTPGTRKKNTMNAFPQLQTTVKKLSSLHLRLGLGKCNQQVGKHKFAKISSRIAKFLRN